jgi:hypothetical protein
MLRASIASQVLAIVLVFTAAAAQAAAFLPIDPWRLCPQAIAVAERTQVIPKHLLSAIAIAESGRTHPTLDKRMPWPWTVMAEGQGRYLPSKAAAIDEVRQLRARGVTNIDVGCMQVNLYYHPDAFASLDQAFDPASNVAYAGQFLRSLFADSGSWHEAAGRYHSSVPGLKNPYLEKVVQIWDREQRLEVGGDTAFGSGPLTAGIDRGLAVAPRVRSPALLLSMAERRLAMMTPRVPAASGSTPLRTYYLAPAGDRTARLAPTAGQTAATAGQAARDLRTPMRTADGEAAFALRRAQYLQELRKAIAEVRTTVAMEAARDLYGRSARLQDR